MAKEHMCYISRDYYHRNSILIGWEIPDISECIYKLVDKFGDEKKADVIENFKNNGGQYDIYEYLKTFIPDFFIEDLGDNGFLMGVAKYGDSISFSTLKLLQEKANFIKDVLGFSEPEIFPGCHFVPK